MRSVLRSDAAGMALSEREALEKRLEKEEESGDPDDLGDTDEGLELDDRELGTDEERSSPNSSCPEGLDYGEDKPEKQRKTKGRRKRRIQSSCRSLTAEVGDVDEDEEEEVDGEVPNVVVSEESVVEARNDLSLAGRRRPVQSEVRGRAQQLTGVDGAVRNLRDRKSSRDSDSTAGVLRHRAKATPPAAALVSRGTSPMPPISARVAIASSPSVFPTALGAQAAAGSVASVGRCVGAYRGPSVLSVLEREFVRLLFPGGWLTEGLAKWADRERRDADLIVVDMPNLPPPESDLSWMTPQSAADHLSVVDSVISPSLTRVSLETRRSRACLVERMRCLGKPEYLALASFTANHLSPTGTLLIRAPIETVLQGEDFDDVIATGSNGKLRLVGQALCQDLVPNAPPGDPFKREVLRTVLKLYKFEGKNLSSSESPIPWIFDPIHHVMPPTADEQIAVPPLLESVDPSSCWSPDAKQLPLRYAMALLLAFSDPMKLVLQPFCGIGTIALACALTGRRFVGDESNRDYRLLCCCRLRALHDIPCGNVAESDFYPSVYTWADFSLRYVSNWNPSVRAYVANASQDRKGLALLANRQIAALRRNDGAEVILEGILPRSIAYVFGPPVSRNALAAEHGELPIVVSPDVSAVDANAVGSTSVVVAQKEEEVESAPVLENCTMVETAKPASHAHEESPPRSGGEDGSLRVADECNLSLAQKVVAISIRRYIAMVTKKGQNGVSTGK